MWQSIGLDPSRQHDDADICGAKGNTHDASLSCTDNFPRWGALYQ